MRTEKLTVKAQEALSAARSEATERQHAQVQPEHLLLALLEQDGGIAARILAKLGADPRVVITDLNRRLEREPKISGANDVDASRALVAVWDAAAREAKGMKDEYVSTEHFVLALADAKGAAGDALRAAGATKASVLEALMAVRQAFGDDAVVLSTRPCAEGVEVLAMAPESLQQIERVAAAPSPAAPARAGAGGRRHQPQRRRRRNLRHRLCRLGFARPYRIWCGRRGPRDRDN